MIERHLSRFLIGSDPRDVERLWDQMWRGSLYYGRKGLAICAISAVDLALWDLCGKLRDEPVYKLLGGETKDAIPCYVTGIKPAATRSSASSAPRCRCPHGPADGRDGLLKNVEMVARAREEVGPDFDLMLDCYMALDVPYTIELADALRPYRVRWIEEPLPPDDYDGHARIKAACPWQRFTTGEHEYTRYGFRELIARANVDILQPDLAWVGGITEARKIAAMAAAHDLPVVPHGSGVFSSTSRWRRRTRPFQEILAMSPDGDRSSRSGATSSATRCRKTARSARPTGRAGASSSTATVSAAPSPPRPESRRTRPAWPKVSPVEGRPDRQHGQ